MASKRKPTLDERLDNLVERLNAISDYFDANPPKQPTTAAPPRLKLVVDNARKVA